jgi:hypothetical protein
MASAFSKYPAGLGVWCVLKFNATRKAGKFALLEFMLTSTHTKRGLIEIDRERERERERER